MKETIAALYCRVSTDMQAERGESIDQQKTVLQEYAKENGLRAVVYEDTGFSAKDTNRPAMTRLINDIKNNKINTVIVTKLDRITRSIKDLIELLELFEKYQVRFKSVTQQFDTSSAMGRTFLSIMGAFAQLEREMISDRVSESLKHRAKKGKWNGGTVAYGYMIYPQLVREYKKSGLSQEKAEVRAIQKTSDKKKAYINEEEAKIVRMIFEKYLETRSIRTVTHWLNEKGIKTRFNAYWSNITISRILKNPVYIGKICYNKRVSSNGSHKRPKDQWIVVDGEHEAIIDKRIFDQAQKILEEQSIQPKRKNSGYLLSGLLRCSKCGGTLCGRSQQRIVQGNEKDYVYYKCYGYHDRGDSYCKGLSVRADELERVVLDSIHKLIGSKDFRIECEKALESFNRETKDQKTPLTKEKQKLEQKATILENKKRNLLGHLEDNTIDKATYRARAYEIEEEYKKVQNRISEIEVKLSSICTEETDFNLVYQLLKDFKMLWKHATFEEKKELLWSLISKINVKDGGIKLQLYFNSTFFTQFANACISKCLYQR